MIRLEKGNLLQTHVDALVNTVNTVGVMGKGVALQFKQAHPDNYKAYKQACDRGEVELGHMFVWDSGRLGLQRYIINFPTKKHWRGRSRLEDIRSGLDDLARVIVELKIESIALPALGCGNGGLSWTDVLPLIESALDPLDVNALVFPPAGSPSAADMPIATRRPKMTYGRAALVSLLAAYGRAAMTERFDLVRPGASLLEIQKLMYLMQEQGQPLRLRYAKGQYGPYAENLNKVLEMLEGHYVTGYGDRTQAVLNLDPIELLPSAEEEASDWLMKHPEVRQSVDKVLEVVAGWESAYGMELLATVLFAARADPRVSTDPGRAVEYVHSWNSRKQATFPEQHVEEAWRRLDAAGWLASA